MKLTIAFTVSCLREKYLRQALDSWSKVRGVQDAHLLFCLEPLAYRTHPFPVAEFGEFLRRSFASTQVITNEVRKGCFINTRDTMDHAFAGGAEFAVLAEEDLVVSADVLEYFAWAQRFRDEQQVQAVCAHSFETDGAAHHVVRADWFSPLVWGTWLRQWHSFIRPGWGGIPSNPEAWDTNLRYLIRGHGQHSVFPAWSRSQHIGRASTLTPGPLAEYFYQGSISKTFHPDYPQRAEYSEVPRDSIRLTV